MGSSENGSIKSVNCSPVVDIMWGRTEPLERVNNLIFTVLYRCKGMDRIGGPDLTKGCALIFMGTVYLVLLCCG